MWSTVDLVVDVDRRVQDAHHLVEVVLGSSTKLVVIPANATQLSASERRHLLLLDDLPSGSHGRGVDTTCATIRRCYPQVLTTVTIIYISSSHSNLRPDG